MENKKYLLHALVGFCLGLAIVPINGQDLKNGPERRDIGPMLEIERLSIGKQPEVSIKALQEALKPVEVFKKLKEDQKPEKQSTTVVPAIMEKIAVCESGGNQFKPDGQVKISRTGDVGKYQINLKVHLARSKKLGYDIYTLKGNEDYAMWLYVRSGTRSWYMSQHCWSKK